MTQTYSEKLKDPRWQQKRLRIFERDKWACQMCGDKTTTLHVHHKRYERGKEPWDYPDDALVTACAPCHENEHTPKTVKPIKIYLAGKITKNGWREDIVTGLRDANIGCCPEGPDEPQPTILESSIFGIHHYTGPFFVACDHGCFHGKTTHGSLCGYKSEIPSVISPQRKDLWRRCVSGIRSADLMFAWIDSVTCYGTLVEIGYAESCYHMPTYIACPPGLLPKLKEIWIALNACFRVIEAPTPKDGLEMAIQSYLTNEWF